METSQRVKIIGDHKRASLYGNTILHPSPCIYNVMLDIGYEITIHQQYLEFVA